METTHNLKLVAQRGGEIRFIRATEQGLPCWFYVRLNPARLLEYEHRLKFGSLDVREFGTVLHSDWGIHPPADVVAFMRDTYGVETPEDDED